jgi:hypothetical protein
MVALIGDKGQGRECAACGENEQRDSMYTVSTFLLDHFWGQADGHQFKGQEAEQA